MSSLSQSQRAVLAFLLAVLLALAAGAFCVAFGANVIPAPTLSWAGLLSAPAARQAVASPEPAGTPLASSGS